jgi:hypothetical protein
MLVTLLDDGVFSEHVYTELLAEVDVALQDEPDLKSDMAETQPTASEAALAFKVSYGESH